MIVTSPDAFLAALERLPPRPAARATAQAAFLVAPAAAELAAQSAHDNRYMQMNVPFDPLRALAQHAALAAAGARYFSWPPPPEDPAAAGGMPAARLVCGWTTTGDEVRRFLGVLGAALGSPA